MPAITMNAVRFSDHAHLKLEILKTHGILLDRELIEDVVLRPQKLEQGYGGRKIAQKGLDPDHVLRVVYEEHPEELVIITFYPGRRERYDKD
jgi:hypothetical protein